MTSASEGGGSGSLGAEVGVVVVVVVVVGMVVGASGLTGRGVTGLWEIGGGGLDGVSVGSLAGEVVAMIWPQAARKER